ncbi:RNA-binding protein [Flavitalea sp. BT771]|uniref:RNA recognition motif domain-containing protein n=1 Tax=Flavitalea sp. BT771 TaxID=3063329 RepID=UPI0026E2381C|nr:RNA-binding protein [Flavitalea sp. BT771]MDO6432808.1 RNA-binding protein [Flavitalea sp. BT771]MDV6221916.1 RNA-binding protein [Flavitalea sp. BT771]
MQILIGNLNSNTTAKHLTDLFLPYGAVYSCKIVSDTATGHSIGIGYIDMESHYAKVAIQQLNRLQFMNYYMEVSEVH